MGNAVELLSIPGLAGGLARLEDALRGSVVGDDPFLTEVAGHLIGAGGKRLRPALTLASALAGGAEPTQEVVLGGVSVELVHLGSLYHDDVIDEATTRRGVDSVNARYGNVVAIVAGDFLLARASGIAADLGTEVSALLAATIGRLCEGEVGEVRTSFDPGRTEKDYFASIEGKTASLFSCACRVGALTAGLDRPLVDALGAFGNAFGMAFQIADDVADVVGSDEQLGKPAGHDLVEGVYTLPVLRALASPDGPELRSLLGAPLDEATRDKARTIVRGSGGVEAALAVARGYAARAAAALAPLDPSPAVDRLGDLGTRLLDDLS